MRHAAAGVLEFALAERMHAVSKYLKSHAESEIRLAGELDGGYERAVVVPAYREDPRFVEGLVGAAQASRGRTLAIVVVNAPDDAPRDAHSEDERLIEGLVQRLHGVRRVEQATVAWHGSLEGTSLDVLVIDRASERARLPPKQGVGLARKIGSDVALALHVDGKVKSALVFGTDADAVLPDGYFDAPGVETNAGLAAVVFPFWHEPAHDPAITRATALYELSLRYYVAGLAWAGSPYAFHTLGSATAVSAHAYAAVRGYPKREAAEDFYLLNKLAKVGAVLRAGGPPVRIQSRASDRTPFGTGRRVAEAIASGEHDFYSPDVFAALRPLFGALESFAEHGAVERLYADIDVMSDCVHKSVIDLFENFDARTEFEAASREVQAPAARRRRVHSWLDAWRTLKLVHSLRARCFPSVPWRTALAAAPFCEPSLGRDDVTFASARTMLADAERNLPRYAGPTVD